MGQFLGFLNEHSSLVANFCHLSTGYISPRFHLVFGDLFETVIFTIYYGSAVFNYLF